MEITKLREKIGKSQKQLALDLEIPAPTLNKYENSLTEPNIKTLIKIADYFNVSIDELVGRETDTINLKYLDENEAYLIRKILKMNQLELAKTKAYVMGLTED